MCKQAQVLALAHVHTYTRACILQTPTPMWVCTPMRKHTQHTQTQIHTHAARAHTHAHDNARAKCRHMLAGASYTCARICAYAVAHDEAHPRDRGICRRTRTHAHIAHVHAYAIRPCQAQLRANLNAFKRARFVQAHDTCTHSIGDCTRVRAYRLTRANPHPCNARTLCRNQHIRARTLHMYTPMHAHALARCITHIRAYTIHLQTRAHTPQSHVRA